MLKKPKNLISIWSEYIKLYEDMKLTSLPEELKQMTKEIRDVIKDDVSNNKSFSKHIETNGLKINLSIEYTKNQKSMYFSDVDIYKLIYENEIIDINVIVEDTEINLNSLMSVINHELRHVYDVFMINDNFDMKPFTDLLLLNRFKKNIDNKKYKYFTDLMYLSFEHEFIARNCMLYDKFVYDGYDKEKLYELFKSTYTYEALIQLQNFNADNFINSFDKNELEQVTKELVKEMNYNFTNANDFYKNWEKYFKDKSEKYLKHAHEMLDLILNQSVKENYKSYVVYPSYRERQINSPQDLLKHIFQYYF